MNRKRLEAEKKSAKHCVPWRERVAQLWQHIDEYQQTFRVAPSNAVIARRTGLHHGTVSDVIRHALRHGALVRSGTGILRLVSDAASTDDRMIRIVPITCSDQRPFSWPAATTDEGFLVDARFLGRNSERTLYMVRLGSHDTETPFRITRGDRLIVSRARERPRVYQWVLATIDGHLRIRWLGRLGGGPVLMTHMRAAKGVPLGATRVEAIVLYRMRMIAGAPEWNNPAIW